MPAPCGGCNRASRAVRAHTSRTAVAARRPSPRWSYRSKQVRCVSSERPCPALPGGGGPRCPDSRVESALRASQLAAQGVADAAAPVPAGEPAPIAMTGRSPPIRSRRHSQPAPAGSVSPTSASDARRPPSGSTQQDSPGADGDELRSDARSSTRESHPTQRISPPPPNPVMAAATPTRATASQAKGWGPGRFIASQCIGTGPTEASGTAEDSAHTANGCLRTCLASLFPRGADALSSPPARGREAETPREFGSAQRLRG